MENRKKILLFIPVLLATLIASFGFIYGMLADFIQHDKLPWDFEWP